MHNFNLIYSHLVRIFLSVFPDAPLIMRFRGWLYSLLMPQCGRNFQVASTAVLRGLEMLSCGDDVYIGPNSYVMARIGVVIESEVLLAMNVVVVDGNHGKNKITNSYRFEKGSREPILMRRGAWIAANSVITSGSVIECGTLVPPCTVVRKPRSNI